MSPALWLSGALAVLAIVCVFWRTNRTPGGADTAFEPPSRLVELSPLCPWRNPEADLPRAFPKANRWETETRILSGLRVELLKELGRQPDAEENTLTLHRVYQDSRPLGSVLARRVKGQHGAIEVVLAVTEDGRVPDVWLQRFREPPPVARALQDTNWLKVFRGRTDKQGWEANDLRDLPPEAHVSAEAIREGVRSLLILLATSERTKAPSTGARHH